MKGVWRPEERREGTDRETKAGVREAAAATMHRAAPALDKKQCGSKGAGSERATGAIRPAPSPARLKNSEQQKTLHFSSAGRRRPAGRGKAFCTQMKYNQALRSWHVDLRKKQGDGKKGQGVRGEIEKQSLSLCFDASQAPKTMKHSPRWQSRRKNVAFPRHTVPFIIHQQAICRRALKQMQARESPVPRRQTPALCSISSPLERCW